MVAASSKGTGALPDGWRLARLADVAEVNPRRTRLNVRDDFPVRFLPMAAVGEQLSGVIEHSDRPFSEVASGYTYFEQGDVIFAKITPCLQNGKHALLKDLPHGFGFGSTEFHVVRAGSQLDPRHLFRALTQAHNIRECVNSFTGTAGQQRVQPDILESLPILLPPLPEQRAIAAVLDTIDDAIEHTEAVIAATERLRDSLLHELLTRGVPGWHTEWKEAPGLGTIPACWEVARLGEGVTHVGSGVTPRGGKSAYAETGVMFLRSQNVHFDGLKLKDVAYIPSEIDKSMRRSRVEPADVLLNITGASIGRCTVVPWNLGPANVNQHVCIIRTSEMFNERFVAKWLSTARSQREINDIQTGQSRQGLNYQQVRQLTIVSPSRAEQDYIASALDGVDEVIAQARRERDRLQLLKASAADALLSGRVRVPSGG